MSDIFHAKFIDYCLSDTGFAVRTSFVAYQDPKVARFVERATAERLGPSVFELTGEVFPWSVPRRHLDTPLWAHWLGSDLDDVMEELYDMDPVADVHRSNDLCKRREMLCWNTSTHAICTSARGLTSSLRKAHGSFVMSVFISPNFFVSTPVRVNDALVNELNKLAAASAVASHLPGLHSQSERSTALVRSVLMGNEPKHDAVGREIVLLKKRALPANWSA